MQIINSIDLGLNIIEEGQQLDTQALTESVRIDVEDLKEELNSKPVMPKVFDDWYKNDSIHGDPNTLKFKIIHFTVMVMWGGKGIESQEQLCDWIKKTNKGKYTYDEERFARCIEAIIHGYEVEK
ncbi:hypothetical protein FD03_GL002576 [Companilactobacillus nodensis DSM 19682 = JCM 14932 = NBRC 107160]|uniref:Uncharacterized protein n=2 Tax=Companilactobacillus nodensis TaxID=460870 RepID=A0A0R1K9A1_9LACO|nr:hypothetical protein FD03_GL002576 [Companilactobacillus nodensis DSM 19682 = JCM 14932 = NBRC 107160]